jgi:hypothetical protein
MWSGSLTCVFAIAAIQQGATDATLVDRRSMELPSGAIARALEALAPDTKPIDLPAELGAPGRVPGPPADAWNQPGTWTRWAALVDAESRASTPDPVRRAELALLALEQERWDDAWRELEVCAATPGWLSALLPRFLPGAPAGSPLAPGGRTGRLPDGVTLVPSLPPSTRDAPTGRVDRRAMRIDDLAIGDAIIELKVAVEAEGVQVDVTHRSGGAARFSLRIPEPADFAIAQEYVDWYRQDALRVAHSIEVKPGDPTHTFYGRFEAHSVRFTAQLPTQLNAQLQTGTLWILSGEEPGERALAREIAESLEKGPLKIAARALGASEQPADAEWTGVRLDLRDATERQRKLAWLASSVEHFALRAKDSEPR